MMFVVPMYYQVFKQASTGEAGSYLVLSMAGNTIGGLLTGWYIGRYGNIPLRIPRTCHLAAFHILNVDRRSADVWANPGPDDINSP